MKKRIWFHILVTLVFVSFLFLTAPLELVSSKAVAQSSQNITATGQFCNSELGYCGDFSITFNPAGGAVSGSFSATYSSAEYGVLHESGGLTGTFQGGDGGSIGGTIVNGIWEWACPGTDCFVSTPASLSGRSWNGNIYANGSGGGLLDVSTTWKVTFSAADFQAGLPKATLTESPTARVVPTLQGLPAATPEPLTSGLTDIVIHASDARLHGWLEIDQTAAQMLGQDGSIIGLDSDGNYFVIDNQGIRAPLPESLQSDLKIADEFGLLQNIDLLGQIPAIQALVAEQGQGALAAITGTGGNQYFQMPDWLQQRQFLSVLTDCYQGVCSGYTKVSILNYSFYFNVKALASSEHSSVRGTINGGGDFIFAPEPRLLASIDLPPLDLQKTAQSTVYLGAMVKNLPDGAEVMEIQLGSPADLAGLHIGDKITGAAGITVDGHNSLASLLDGHQSGESIPLEVLRDGTSQSVDVTLAELRPMVIQSPAADITVSDKTRLVVDIGLNGVTAVIVLADSANVSEPVTNTDVDVKAGQGLIVVPGQPVGRPFDLAGVNVNKWWEHSTSTLSTDPSQNASNPSGIQSAGFKDFDPIKGVDEGGLILLGFVVLVLAWGIGLIVILIKKP